MLQLKIHLADVQLCLVGVRAVRNLAVGLLQSQHTADGDQWKVTFIFSAGYVFSASLSQTYQTLSYHKSVSLGDCLVLKVMPAGLIRRT